MKTNILRLLLLVITTVIFDYLFYRQSPGINVFLLSVLIPGVLWTTARNPFTTRKTLITMAVLLISGISVAVNGTALSFIAFLGSVLIFTGYSLEPAFKSIFSAGFQSGINFLTASAKLVSESFEIIQPKHRLPWFWKIFKLLLIPIAILVIFTTLYRFAIPLFNNYFQLIDQCLSVFVDWLNKNFNVGHLMFLVFAALFMTGILYQNRYFDITGYESAKSDELKRSRKRRSNFFRMKPGITKLKDEYRMGIILLTLMNALLLIVNITEIAWLNGEYRNSTAVEMSSNLHEGTGLLILSIILSILVILRLFRRNLNFYPDNKWLVRGGLAWIIQNAIMGLNVAARNWFYISQYGLTYKRIGVYFFLLLVLAGLALLWIKVKQKKSLWYLVRMNGWSFYFAFIILSLVNWNTVIINYNLRPKAPTTDVDFLLDLPARNVKSLLANKEKLFHLKPDDTRAIDSIILNKRQWFMEDQQAKGWQSSNLTDLRALHYIKTEINK